MDDATRHKMSATAERGRLDAMNLDDTAARLDCLAENLLPAEGAITLNAKACELRLYASKTREAMLAVSILSGKDN